MLVAITPAQVQRVDHELYIAESWGLEGIEAWDEARLAELLASQKSKRTQMFFVGRRTIPWPPHVIRFPILHGVRAPYALGWTIRGSIRC